MLWLNKHARLRPNLSPYIDGRLTASERTALEAHLVSCEACRRELDELRATVSVLHELPKADPPRSFAITPGMLERKTAAAARPLPALGLGMRLAGTAVAVALAVVLVGDFTLGDNRGASREAGGQPATEARLTAESDLTSDADKYAAEDQARQGATPLVPQSNAGATAACPPIAASPPAAGGGAAGGAGGPASGGGTSGGGGSGETPAATATPQPVPSSASSPGAPATGLDVATICSDSSGGAAAPVAPEIPQSSPAGPGTAANATRAASAANDGGGISTLRVVEIVLAGLLIATLAGIVVEAALRRRTA